MSRKDAHLPGVEVRARLLTDASLRCEALQEGTASRSTANDGGPGLEGTTV
jgi:hypothetical protein